MPDNLKLLIVILALAIAVFSIARKPAAVWMETGDFTRRRNLWFALTVAAFLSLNFWVYTFIAIPLLIYANRAENNPAALFFFVLFALPMNTIHISGMGLVDTLFELSHARILEMITLLPASALLMRQNNALPFGRTPPDKMIAAYLLLTVALYLRDTSLTDALRYTFYLFLDVALPYFVISRSLKDLQAFRDALSSFVIAMMMLALVGLFEFFKVWLLYEPLVFILQMDGGMRGYLIRDDMLRVVASAGQPIVLGYLMAVAIGLYLYLKNSIRHRLMRRSIMALLASGLIVALSRGPWVGAAVLFLVFAATGRKPAFALLNLAVAAMVALPLISVLPGTEKVINLLPFIGTVDRENVEFRQNLLTNSMIVIKRHPLLGSSDFWETPEMEALRSGDGIIDIVNTYVGVALQQGLIGLVLFAGFFALTLLGIYRAMRTIPDKDSEEHLLGRALVATLFAIMIMIFTVSSITFIPIVYWSVAAMGVAYAQMVRRQAEEGMRSASQHVPLSLIKDSPDQVGLR